jgi:hypothetical protein
MVEWIGGYVVNYGMRMPSCSARVIHGVARRCEVLGGVETVIKEQVSR